MRVTHVIFNLFTGGTELLLLDIMRHQIDQGAEVSLVVINKGADPEVARRIPEGINTIFLDRVIGSKNPLWLWRFNRALSALRPEVVHFHNDRSVGMTWRRRGVKYVGTIHAPEVVLDYSRRLDRIYAISDGVRDDLKRRYDIDPTVILNGVDTDRIAKRTDIPGNTPRPLKIVQVGRLDHDIKGQDLLLKAIAELPDGAVTVDFIGDGPSRELLENLSRELGVERRVNFLGLRDRDYVYSHLRDYDLFVQPSRLEGFGLTVAEAMAANVPVLVSDLDGPMEVIDHGRLGSHFTADDHQSLAKAIETIIADYPRLATSVAAEAADWARDRLSVAATARYYLADYCR